jgi:hypothetical protein
MILRRNRVFVGAFWVQGHNPAGVLLKKVTPLEQIVTHRLSKYISDPVVTVSAQDTPTVL